MSQGPIRTTIRARLYTVKFVLKLLRIQHSVADDRPFEILIFPCETSDIILDLLFLANAKNSTILCGNVPIFENRRIH